MDILSKIGITQSLKLSRSFELGHSALRHRYGFFSFTQSQTILISFYKIQSLFTAFSQLSEMACSRTWSKHDQDSILDPEVLVWRIKDKGEKNCQIFCLANWLLAKANRENHLNSVKSVATKDLLKIRLNMFSKQLYNKHVRLTVLISKRMDFIKKI